jgi:hypothetical protein
VAAVGLCSPAVYSPDAWEVPFGNGQGRFTGTLRTPDSWRASSALEAYRAYGGRAVLVVPGTDAVIPPAVTAAVQEALSTRADYTRFELPGPNTGWGSGSATTRRTGGSSCPGCWPPRPNGSRWSPFRRESVPGAPPAGRAPGVVGPSQRL